MGIEEIKNRERERDREREMPNSTGTQEMSIDSILKYRLKIFKVIKVQ